jgi:hypothetical protein
MATSTVGIGVSLKEQTDAGQSSQWARAVYLYENVL